MRENPTCTIKLVVTAITMAAALASAEHLQQKKEVTINHDNGSGK